MAGNGESIRSNNQTVERINDPHDHDVLLGRGGLTNHHPGNNWFRRLVRSNKELYDNSQKHTKLLVAKAIVHHVQSQTPPGRFLHRPKESGLWEPVCYKKAVDKTSQALRERKGPENNSTFDTSAPQPYFSAPIDNANPSVPQSTGLTHNDGFDNKPPPMQQTESWYWRINKKPKTSAFVDPIPLPTEPLATRASSLFSFFTMFKLLNDKKSDEPGLSGSYHRNGQETEGRLTSFDQSMEPTRLPPSNARFLSNNGSMEAHSMQIMEDSNSIEPLPLAPNKKRHREYVQHSASSTSSHPRSDAAGAPSLTRLSTQASDWLQSFWPLGDHAHAINKCGSVIADQSPQSAIQVEEQLTEPTPTPAEQPLNSQDLQRQLSIISKNVSDLQRLIQSGEAGSTAVETIYQTRLHMEQLQMLQAYGTTTAPVENYQTADPPSASLPPPTTLEPSVSSAIWHLASTPVRLFTGLSTLFSESLMPTEIDEYVHDVGDLVGGLANSNPDEEPGGITTSSVAEVDGVGSDGFTGDAVLDLDSVRVGSTSTNLLYVTNDHNVSDGLGMSPPIVMNSKLEKPLPSDDIVFGRRTSASLFDDDC